jgi:hypothetical protein
MDSASRPVTLNWKTCLVFLCRCTVMLFCFVCLQHYEIWSVSVLVEHRLQVFEKKVLRKVFLPNKLEVGLSEQFK